jgi:hypothetical protein
LTDWVKAFFLNRLSKFYTEEVTKNVVEGIKNVTNDIFYALDPINSIYFDIFFIYFDNFHALDPINSIYFDNFFIYFDIFYAVLFVIQEESLLCGSVVPFVVHFVIQEESLLPVVDGHHTIEIPPE